MAACWRSAAAPARPTCRKTRAEGLLHVYNGGGVTAWGPAFLVRKSVADRFSITGSYYLDAVSNASIDVVTTASKYSETRHEFALAGDYVYRDSRITLAGSTSHEPDYVANRFSLDISQEVFGGMTTVSLGFTRGDDKVSKKDSPEFSDSARHWQYRLGISQILTPRWIMSFNAEALSDDGYLGSPYRAARVFGAAVPERNPRTRSGRALMLRLKGDLGSRDAMHAGYRYYYDNWDDQGPHRWSSATAATSRNAGWPTPSCATTPRATRSSTATTPRARPPTSRATASSAPSTTPRSAPRSHGCGARSRAGTRSSSTAPTSSCTSSTRTSPTSATATSTAYSASILQLYVTGTF